MTPDGFWRGGASDAFADRHEAGRQLARRLSPMVGDEDTVVLALPRGGVPVAEEVAEELGAALDVMLVRKVGVPWQPELALGAVASGDVTVFNDDVVRATGLTSEDIDRAVERERGELERREGLYREGRPAADVTGKTVIVVDDGIATGATVRAALRALEQRGAARTIVASPVAPPETVASLRTQADDVVCLKTPDDLRAIGLWYEDFTPISDDEVVRALRDRAGG